MNAGIHVETAIIGMAKGFDTAMSITNEESKSALLAGLQTNSKDLEDSAKMTCSTEDFGNSLDSASVLDTFIYFPNLPSELRLKIWKAAMPGPRLIDIAYEYEYEQDPEDEEMVTKINTRTGSDGAPIFNERVMINHPPPIVLHICQESRTEALKKYSIKLGYDGVRAHDLVDPLDDVLLVVCSRKTDVEELILESDQQVLSDEAHNKIQQLAIDIDAWEPGDLNSLIRFKALKELTLVLHWSRCRDSWRQKTTKVVFTEAGIRLVADRYVIIQNTKQEYERLKHANPAWAMPELKFMRMTRGDAPCCTGPSQRIR